VAFAEPFADGAGGAAQAAGEFGEPALVFAGSLGGVGGPRRAAAGHRMAVAAQDLVDDAVADRPVVAG
jgi:hypothetical protein